MLALGCPGRLYMYILKVEVALCTLHKFYCYLCSKKNLIKFQKIIELQQMNSSTVLLDSVTKGRTHADNGVLSAHRFLETTDIRSLYFSIMPADHKNKYWF